jgi:hypothetical protein
MPLHCHIKQQKACLIARIALSQDRLPTPFGLVRSGVAPDHADTKVQLFGSELLGTARAALRILYCPNNSCGLWIRK